MFEFNNRLKTLRLSKNLTQKQVAEAMEVSERNYQYFEYGKVKPSFDNIIKLCKFFNVTADYLLGMDNLEINEK